MRRLISGLTILFIAAALAPSAAGKSSERASKAECMRWTTEYQLRFKQRQIPEATVAAERALRAAERAFGNQDVLVSQILNDLGFFYHQQARHADAERVHRRALAIRHRFFGQDDASVVQSQNNLAKACHARGRYQEAAALFRASLAVLERRVGPDHARVAEVLGYLADGALQQHRAAEAKPLYERALGITDREGCQLYFDVAWLQAGYQESLRQLDPTVN